MGSFRVVTQSGGRKARNSTTTNMPSASSHLKGDRKKQSEIGAYARGSSGARSHPSQIANGRLPSVFHALSGLCHLAHRAFWNGGTHLRADAEIFRLVRIAN